MALATKLSVFLLQKIVPQTVTDTSTTTEIIMHLSDLNHCVTFANKITMLLLVVKLLDFLSTNIITLPLGMKLSCYLCNDNEPMRLLSQPILLLCYLYRKNCHVTLHIKTLCNLFV